MIFIKIAILGFLGVIIYQDFKDREVYGFIFPILISLLGILHYQNVVRINFLYTILINIGVLAILMGILYLYTLIKLKRPFFEEVFGIGDLLFFVALAIGFPTVAFIIILVFSLLFSLVIWLFLKKESKYDTIPLAGYMSIFLIITLICYWTTNSITLYLI
ncbi:hypothetical protein [Aquimarina longa]|uniref:hypothetical protein n=1 Tax=Aquimarina longa TaxID=1080221 RepID=UPI000782EF28|nr:hypothetical protein [Aquimarina longa]